MSQLAKGGIGIKSTSMIYLPIMWHSTLLMTMRTLSQSLSRNVDREMIGKNGKMQLKQTRILFQNTKFLVLLYLHLMVSNLYDTNGYLCENEM